VRRPRAALTHHRLGRRRRPRWLDGDRTAAKSVRQCLMGGAMPPVGEVRAVPAPGFGRSTGRASFLGEKEGPHLG
jgi:hypothetical protein